MLRHRCLKEEVLLFFVVFFCLQTPLISENFLLLTFIPQAGVGGQGIPPFTKKGFCSSERYLQEAVLYESRVQVAESSEYILWLQFRFEIMLNV